MTYTNRSTGWRRTAIGFGKFRIEPTDGSGCRVVMFLSAGSWQNLENDDRANIDRDRVVLLEGPELPDHARAWLEAQNAKSCRRGREALRAAINDADMNDPAWRD